METMEELLINDNDWEQKNSNEKKVKEMEGANVINNVEPNKKREDGSGKDEQQGGDIQRLEIDRHESGIKDGYKRQPS